VSLFAVLVALLMQVTLEDILRDPSIYLLFVPAVLIAGGVGGFGPGAIATGGSIALGWLLYGSSEAGGLPWSIRTTVFTAIGLGVGTFGECLQRMRLREAARICGPILRTNVGAAAGEASAQVIEACLAIRRAADAGSGEGREQSRSECRCQGSGDQARAERRVPSTSACRRRSSTGCRKRSGKPAATGRRS
jgi:hypothetical protein